MHILKAIISLLLVYNLALTGTIHIPLGIPMPTHIRMDDWSYTSTCIIHVHLYLLSFAVSDSDWVLSEYHILNNSRWLLCDHYSSVALLMEERNGEAC